MSPRRTRFGRWFCAVGGLLDFDTGVLFGGYGFDLLVVIVKVPYAGCGIASIGVGVGVVFEGYLDYSVDKAHIFSCLLGFWFSFRGGRIVLVRLRCRRWCLRRRVSIRCGCCRWWFQSGWFRWDWGVYWFRYCRIR